MLRLEPRVEASRAMSVASPLIALLLTLVIAVLLFVALGKDPLQGLSMFFVEPLKSTRGLSELSIKTAPLLLIALGLCVCFRSNLWNIGAEGQFILGAIGASGVAIRATESSSGALLIVASLCGTLCGMAWAAVVAYLRSRYNANEILVSLMLVYVAEQLLSYVVSGPWKDPQGYNFPQTVTFLDAVRVPQLIEGTRANVGILLALGLVVVVWVFLFRTHAGYRLEVGGLSPLAARYAGFSQKSALWTALLLSGALAGLAGALEATGPVGQLTTHLPLGYGFGAIIVAFVGRLNPFGATLAAVLMSLLYIGGEMSQSRLGLPKSLTYVFQGLLLFLLLACDTFTTHRLRFGKPRVALRSPPGQAAPPPGSEEGVP